MRSLFTVTFLLPILLAGCSLPFLNKEEAVNPDPNHTHADFSIWINNEQLNFSDEHYMSDTSKEGEVADREHEEVTLEGDEEELRKYLHLHDGNGNVIHRHKPGLTFGDFLTSVGMVLTQDCLTLKAGETVCNNNDATWKMVVNGELVAVDPAYSFVDIDHILLSYDATSVQLDAQVGRLTDEACLYSRTCPERGDPPTENCIADPEVPCVIPE